MSSVGLSHAVEVATKAAARQSHNDKVNKAVTFTHEPTAPTLNNDPFRIFILGPRMESRLPAFVWEQLALTFPGVPFRVYFIGPDAGLPSMPVTSSSQGMNSVPVPGSVGTGRMSVMPSKRVHQRPITSMTGPEEQEITIESQVLDLRLYIYNLTWTVWWFNTILVHCLTFSRSFRLTFYMIVLDPSSLFDLRSYFCSHILYDCFRPLFTVWPSVVLFVSHSIWLY